MGGRETNPLVVEAQLHERQELRRKADILEAGKGVPELRDQLLAIMTTHIPKPQWMIRDQKSGWMDTQEGARAFWDESDKSYDDQWRIYVLEFSIGDGEEQPATAIIKSQGYPASETKRYSVEVRGNPNKLSINEGQASIKSTEGTNGMPVSSREMTMEDFRNYNSLLRGIESLQPSKSRFEFIEE